MVPFRMFWSRTFGTWRLLTWVAHVAYSVDSGLKKKKVHWFCVCAGQTVSMLIEQERSRAGVEVRGAEVRPHHSVQLYFRAFCLFTLDVASIRPAGFCYLFSLWVRAPIQSTLSAVTVLHRTHTYTRTHSLGHILLIETRVFLSLPARPLPAARTHIVSHCLPLSHPLWMAPGVLSFLSDFLALSLPPASLFESLLSIYESPHLLPVHVLIILSLPIVSFPFISSLFPQGKEGKGKRQS